MTKRKWSLLPVLVGVVLGAAGCSSASNDDAPAADRSTQVRAACVEAVTAKMEDAGVIPAFAEDDELEVTADGDGWKVTGETFSVEPAAPGGESAAARVYRPTTVECTVVDDGQLRATTARFTQQK